MKKWYIKGITASLPIVFGYIPIGFAFGLLAIQQGLSIVDILFMSLIVYAGSAQFIGAAMIAQGATISTILVTTFLVNLRHMLMSTALSNHMKHINTPTQALISYGITDETFAVAITEAQNQELPSAYFEGLNLTSQAVWTISTVIGGFLGSLVPNPSFWGLDFALYAMFIGLIVIQLKGHIYIIIAIISGLISTAIAVGFKGYWNIIIAAIIGATLGVFLEKWIQE